MSRLRALEKLLRPKTIAVIGGDSAVEVVRQCQAIGFDGEIWAVNPRRPDLAGIPCIPSIDALPGIPDASFVAAPPAASLDIIRKLAERGAPGAVCFAAGFAETGEAGAEMQRRLHEAAGQMPMIGPNCHGFLNYLDGVALWPDEHGGKRTQRGVALISQSGNIAINLTMQQRGLDYSYVISIGNSSSLSLHEYMEALLDDARVTAIGLHIEGLRDVAGFSRAAIKALEKGVPIVALKTGRSTLGAEITMSHTASLAGSDRLYTALFDRVGVARCDTVPQFLETMKFLSLVGTLPANSLGSMSCSGGEASIVADCADRLGIDMPALSNETNKTLRELLGPIVHVANPLDYHLYIWGDEEKLSACFSGMLQNRFGCNVLVLDYPSVPGADTSKWEVAERALVNAVLKTGQRAVIVSSLPETIPTVIRERLKGDGIAPMQGIEDCLFAIRAAAAIGKAQTNAAKIRPLMQPQPEPGKVAMLDEWDSKQLLARAGLAIPAGRICAADGTAAAADALGYPVVVKAVSQDLAHKSESGAVALNLDDAAAVAAATKRMANTFDRFLVEKMVGPVVAELIVGVSRDATFGVTLLLGSGGTLVELLDDTVSLLLPVQREDIAVAVRSLRVSALIDGYRGAPAGNFAAVLDAIEAIAAFAVDNAATLQELDVNPLIVTPDAAVAADALLRKAAS
ncbi:MAG: acetate--CoA ligase family protein [Gammaproteobacteria bacterium]|nr:acetate--CoA ligase family protein [Gammaproteobacteria bacterium]